MAPLGVSWGSGTLTAECEVFRHADTDSDSDKCKLLAQDGHNAVRILRMRKRNRRWTTIGAALSDAVKMGSIGYLLVTRKFHFQHQRTHGPTKKYVWSQPEKSYAAARPYGLCMYRALMQGEAATRRGSMLLCSKSKPRLVSARIVSVFLDPERVQTTPLESLNSRCRPPSPQHPAQLSTRLPAMSVQKRARAVRDATWNHCDPRPHPAPVFPQLQTKSPWPVSNRATTSIKAAITQVPHWQGVCCGSLSSPSPSPPPLLCPSSRIDLQGIFCSSSIHKRSRACPPPHSLTLTCPSTSLLSLVESLRPALVASASRL